ncbi:MAG: hypothetical protein ABJC12_01165 [Saprospiraceae bacterium]
MKNILLILIFIPACSSKKQVDLSKEAAEEIRKTDIEMSDMAVKEGFHKTLLLFADENLVKPQDGELPVIGKANLEKYWASKTETKAISWAPFKTEASRSGDLGYSLGNWTLAAKDTTYYGNYYTIWKKYPDGHWHFLVDGGNNTPAPAN